MGSSPSEPTITSVIRQADECRLLFAPMLHPLEIPKLEPQPACRECEWFCGRLREAMRSRDAELEQALSGDEVTRVERRFSSAYGSLFRLWMNHKLTHETGSLRRYLAILNA